MFSPIGETMLELHVIATAALPMIEKKEFNEVQHTITCSDNIVSPIGENTNCWWYNNDLHKNEDVVPYKTSSTISSFSRDNIKSVISSDNEREQSIQVLRKRLIKCLIDVTSPTSEMKQSLFRKLIANNEDTNTIIEMSIDMESSIEDTTCMLMNNSS